jgi:hypothetical protein
MTNVRLGCFGRNVSHAGAGCSQFIYNCHCLICFILYLARHTNTALRLHTRCVATHELYDYTQETNVTRFIHTDNQTSYVNSCWG